MAPPHVWISDQQFGRCSIQSANPLTAPPYFAKIQPYHSVWSAYILSCCSAQEMPVRALGTARTILLKVGFSQKRDWTKQHVPCRLKHFQFVIPSGRADRARKTAFSRQFAEFLIGKLLPPQQQISCNFIFVKQNINQTCCFNFLVCECADKLWSLSAAFLVSDVHLRGYWKSGCSHRFWLWPSPFSPVDWVCQLPSGNRVSSQHFPYTWQKAKFPSCHGCWYRIVTVLLVHRLFFSPCGK